MLRALKSQIRPLLPKRIKSHLILSGPLKGARIVTSWHDYPAGILGLTERPLLEWFDSHVGKGETWLDVGAHYGYTAIALAKHVGSQGRVFVFEPMVTTAGSLTETCARNGLKQVTVVPLGLDETISLETRQLRSIRGMADLTLGETGGVTSILVIALDQLWNSLSGGIARIDGIKIDVQGMERNVITGMRKILGQFSPKLVIEFHRGVDRTPILNMLADAGYNRSGYSVESRSATDVFEDDHSYAFLPTSPNKTRYSA